MPDNPIRVDHAHDTERFLATDSIVWFKGVPVASTEDRLLGLADDGRFAAEVDGADPETYAGIYAVYRMTLSLPGEGLDTRPVPCAGLSWVGVHPDHRRRGVLNAMMRHHLERVHGDPATHVSALHASEPAIYSRYGYGLGSLELEVDLSRGATLTAPELEAAATEMSTQLATASDADVPSRMRACHLRTAVLGTIVGDEDYYRHVCFQSPEHLREQEPWRVLFARRDGQDVGYAMFRRTHKWDNARTAGELTVWMMVGEPAAQLVLLRRLVDFDLMATVSVNQVGVEDPLVLWAGGPRSTSDVKTYDSLWIRLVDLPEALQQRRWTPPCDLVVDVDDRAAPWNHGTWRIHADAAGQATVERSSADADLALPVSALGAAYLGAGSLVAQHRAGLVSERRPGAVAELSQAMRTPVAPSGAMHF